MDRDTFFKHLRRNPLLSGQAGDHVIAELPETAQGRVMARALVAKGLLTRFQAQKLLAGKSDQLLLGQYCILDRIGRGSTGPVFKAMHEGTGRIVAVKVIHPRVLREDLAFDFTREALAAAELHHPGIVAAYETGVARGRHFLVMEYVDGPSLQSLVQTDGPLQVGLACELMRQAADVLQFAHEKGMVHRDIKPANLLIASGPASAGAGQPASRPAWTSGSAPTPRVKIIDWGLARLHEAGSAAMEGTIKVDPGTVWGTVDYIAPEQAEDIHAADIRSDLYSLGCTFYYALSGRAPFRGTALEKLAKHLFQEAPAVTALRPDVPASVSAIVERLMSKDRACRFQTPAELAQALAGIAAAVGAPPAQTTPELLIEPQPSQEMAHERGKAPPACAAGTVEPAPAAASRRPLVDDAFQRDWQRWTELVACFAKHRRPKVTSRSFDLLRERLLRRCEEGAGAATGATTEFFDRLSGLVRPWLSRGALAQLDRTILVSFYNLCLQGKHGLREIAASQAKGKGGQTVLGSILAVFKRWRA